MKATKDSLKTRERGKEEGSSVRAVVVNSHEPVETYFHIWLSVTLVLVPRPTFQFYPLLTLTITTHKQCL
jgi:hypothetical protein